MTSGHSPGLYYPRTSIYVAASSKERERYQLFCSQLRRIGYEIEFDWATAYDNAERLPKITEAMLREAGTLCEMAIKNAHMFVQLVPKTPSIGAWYELGFARAHHPASVWSVFTSGDAGKLDCWNLRPDTHFSSEKELYAELAHRKRANPYAPWLTPPGK